MDRERLMVMGGSHLAPELSAKEWVVREAALRGLLILVWRQSLGAQPVYFPRPRMN